MQIGLPAGGDVAMLVFVVLYWAVVIGGVVKLIGWIVDRRTRELRQRVALLEHEVAELDGDASSAESPRD
ncbi:hypothetical protein SAMN05216559_2548 [Halomicrobium zhouii]|uniref:Uncharacterized protein n=1 Tax=Halomicrobium zhouii TaxID=767519 RepID=A0A1I6LEB3_9EURY|nr:hypothetical protein [Halomicrobium zhouii]SFS01793.1 hypothetical protein SAMN05216559_2548 [Halomicrobium zhouii]